MIRRVAMLSVHTCPLATLGGKETGGMNVYVRDLSRELGRRGIAVDCFTRSQNPTIPRVSTKLGPNGRFVHVPAGPEAPTDKNLIAALEEFQEVCSELKLLGSYPRGRQVRSTELGRIGKNGSV